MTTSPLGTKELVKWGPLEIGDTSDSKRLKEVFEKHQPSAILHFAAWIDVAESVNFPEKYYENNFRRSLILLATALEAGIHRFIFSSTAAVYGEPQENPITEIHPKNPMNPYGKSKLFFEEALKDYAEISKLKYVVLRYFNASGADPEQETGSLHPEPTHLIPRVLEVPLGIKEKVTIFGN